MKNPLNILGSAFIKNVAFLMSSTFVAQVVSLISLPILSRIYSKEDFAALAVVAATAGLISSIAIGQYQYSIMIEDGKEVVLAVFFCSVIALFSVIVSLGALLIFSNKDFLVVFTIISVAVLTLTVQILTTLQNCHKKFNNIAFSRLMFSIISVLIGISLGYFTETNGLIIGLVLALLVQALILAYHSRSKLYLVEFNVEDFKAFLIRHKNFPLFTLPHYFLDALKKFLMIFITNAFFGMGVVGLYAMAERVIKLPTSLISASISEVFFKDGVEAYKKDRGKLKEYTYTLLKFNIAVILLPAIVLFFFGADIFSFVLGEEWAIAGKYASILSFFLIPSFILSPLSNIPIFYSKQFAFLILATIVFGLSYLSFYLASAGLSDFYLAFSIKTAIETVGYIAIIFWILKIVKN